MFKTREIIKKIRLRQRAVISVLMSFAVLAASLPLSIFAISGNTVSTDDNSASFGSYASYTYELESRREEYVKHFKNPDGTVTAVQFDMPVHRINSDGEWEEIDNTLIASANEYTTSDARIKFAKKTSGNEVLFTLHDGNGKITFSLDGAKKKVSGEITNYEEDKNADDITKLSHLNKLNSSMIYRDILENVDLEYIVVSNSIKENIIVKKPLSSYAFSFTMKLNNFTAEMTEEGAVEIINAKGENIYEMSPPYMYDANGEISERVSYALASLGNNEYEITVTADSEWIHSPERVFPVTIDPSVSPADESVTDLSISSSSPSLNTNVSAALYAGGVNSAYWKNTSLPKLPNYSYITSAVFSMYQYYGSAYIGIYRVTSDWDNTFVYHDFTASSPKGAINAALLDYQNANTPGWYSWNITDLVKKWNDGVYENYGVCLKQVEGTESSGTCFFTSNEGSVSFRPRLMITYTDQFGIEDYWTFLSQNAGTAGNGYVNLANGNLVFNIGTLTSSDNLMPYTANFIYNSNLQGWLNTRLNRENPYSFATIAGGWTTNINQCIVPRTRINKEGVSETYYIYTDADGTQHSFFKSTNEDETYYDEDGLKLKLTYGTNGSGESEFYIEDTSHNKYTFTKKDVKDDYTYPGGFLKNISDANGNMLEFVCNNYGRPSAIKVKPNNGTAVTQMNIYYSTKGVIKYILNPTTQQAVLLYYSNTYDGELGNYYRLLRKVVFAHQIGSTSTTNWNTYYSDGFHASISTDAVCEYEYNEDKRLISVRDGLHKTEIRYTYDSSGRVNTIQEYAGNSYTTPGQKISITYGTGYSYIRASGSDDVWGNPDDICTYYRFDGLGRCISSYSTDIYGYTIYGASSGEYISREENEKAANSLKTSYVVSDLAVNYLANANFEINGASSLQYWSTTGNVTAMPLNYAQSVLSPHTYNRYGYDSDFNIKMSVGNNATSTLYQTVKLPNGDYTLSADVLRFWNTDVTVRLKAESLSDSSRVFTEDFSFRKEITLGEEAQASLSFKVNLSSGAYETFKISLEVIGGADVSDEDYIRVSHMILTKGIGSGLTSRVTYGAFEPSVMNGTSSLSASDFWNSHGASETVHTTTYASQSHSLFMYGGNVQTPYYVSQTIYEASTADRNYYIANQGNSYATNSKQYRISGRAMASGVLANENSRFEIRAEITEIYFENGVQKTAIVSKSIKFNKSNPGWQFASAIIETTKNRFVDKIVVYCDYSYQIGTAFFDEIAVCYIGTDSCPSNTEYNENGMPRKIMSGNNGKYYLYTAGNQVEYEIGIRSVTKYTYDGRHRVSTVSVYNFLGTWGEDYFGFDPDTSDKTLRTVTLYDYDDYGLITNIRTTSYKTENGTTTAESALNTSRTYDTASGSRIFGALLSETDTLGRTTKYFYDENNGYLLAARGYLYKGG